MSAVREHGRFGLSWCAWLAAGSQNTVIVGATLNLVTGISYASRVFAALLFSIATTSLPQQVEPSPLAPVAAPSPSGLEMSTGSAQYRMPDPNKGLLRIDVAVTDKAGKPVSRLSEKDFTLFDNDRQQKIVTFEAFDGEFTQSATSLEVVLVIDELNMLSSLPKGVNPEANDSMTPAKVAVASAYREVETFLRADKGALPQPTIIYRLTRDGLFSTPHASLDGNELSHEIEQPGEQRRIWSPAEVARDIGKMEKGGAVSWRATHSLVALGSIAIEERRRPGRKIMFWIGNGWETAHRDATELSDFSIELLTRMREARINLWKASEWPLNNSNGNAYDPNGNEVMVGDAWPVTDFVYKESLKGPKPDITDLNYLALPVLAVRSGGGVLNLRRNLAVNIEQRVKQGSQFYSLTLDPPRTNAVDQYDHLTIEIDNPDLTAHFFSDYYDQPVFYDQRPIKQPVTVKQLEGVIANSHDFSSAELAHQLDGMRLTERLDSTKLVADAKAVHGRASEAALESLADESVFLAPPTHEIPSTPPPDIAAQRQLISRAVSYINTAIHGLPDFFATRTTVQYSELPPKPDQTWKTAGPDQSLREGETATASIRFHDGKERAEEASVKKAPHKPGSEQLNTVGTFGPILATVMIAATMPDSELTWSRWEQRENGRLAVFRYRVPHETSLFFAEFCCLAVDFEEILFKKSVPFHGEIAVDPSTGAILRLTTQADLEWRLPLERSDVMVEYRPVVKGTRTFVCPLRSVSISRQRRTMVIEEWGEGFKVYAPFETLLNEMRFEKYHFFGSTSRMIPGFCEVPKNQ